MQRLVVYADYACPFCYLASIGVARLQRDGVVDVENAAFELRPAGTPLPEPDAPWMRAGWTRQVEPLSREMGVTMHFPRIVARTRKAHEAAVYARGAGLGAEMHDAIYRAYWQDGLDIGRIDVLVQVGESVGLDRTALRIALDIDAHADEVQRQRDEAARLGLTAVPAYVLGAPAGDGAMNAAALRMGLLRYEELRAWVENAT